MKTNKAHIKWQDIHDIIDLFGKKLSDKGFTDIIGIARGGLMPAQLLAHKLKISRVHSIGINFYEKDSQDGLRKTPLTYQLLTSSFKDSRILLVDEIVDSGSTFEHALSYLNSICPGIDVTTFTMFYKPCSRYKPQHVGTTVPSDTWVNFPYDEQT